MPLAVAVLVGLPMVVMVAAVVADRAAGRSGVPGAPSGDGDDMADGVAPASAPSVAVHPPEPPPHHANGTPQGEGWPPAPPARRGPSPSPTTWRVRPPLRLVRRARGDLAAAWLAAVRAQGGRVEVRGPDGVRVRGRLLAFGAHGIVIAAGEPLLVPRRAIWTVRALPRRHGRP